MEFKAKFKRTAGAGLNLCGASVNFRSASLSLYDANMKFKISDLLRGSSGVNFKSASLNLHGDKELEFKNSAACFCGLKRHFKRSTELNFKISNPRPTAACKPKRLAPRNFKNFIVCLFGA